MREEAWWQPFYDRWLAAVLLDRSTPAELEATVDFLVEVLGLGPGDRVFDQCCGNGRLALPMAARGLEVVGVDQAAGYVEEANEEARRLGLSVALEPGDAFSWTPALPCDGAFNWWTSFGYGAGDEENLPMLRRAFEGLRPGGRFALDWLNLPGVLRGFQPAVVDRAEVEEGQVTLLRESRLDLTAGYLRKRWTYLLPDGNQVVHHSRVRLYLPHQLVELMQRAGFEQVQCYGAEDGRPLEPDSPRCIVVGQRPLAPSTVVEQEEEAR